MKTALAIVIGLLALWAIGFFIPRSIPTSAQGCDPALWQHVYHPFRLRVLDNCKEVIGTIESIKAEQDGDLHIRLKLDASYGSLINQANINGQQGDLVLEPICVGKVTQDDAQDACRNFHSTVTVPAESSHVKVKGSYVLDLMHGGWAEIHPVSSFEVIK